MSKPMATPRPAGWSTAGPTRRNGASGFWKRRWGIEVDSVHDRFEVGSGHPDPPCGEAVGRGTAREASGGGAATSRHSPSVSASRCHLPIASQQGGSLYPYRRLLPLPLSVRVERSRDTHRPRSEEHTSELKSLMRNSYAVFC